MEMLALLGLGFFIWAESQDRSTSSRKSAAPRRLRRLAQQRVGPAFQKVWLGSRPGPKGKAFSMFIGWARTEAKRQGRCFESIRGKNDYQRARAVFQHSREWGG